MLHINWFYNTFIIPFVSLIRNTDKRRRKSEEQQYGIYFDDDYDYLQHVKPRTDLSLEPLPDNVTVIEAKKPSAADHLEVLSISLIKFK